MLAVKVEEMQHMNKYSRLFSSSQRPPLSSHYLNDRSGRGAALWLWTQRSSALDYNQRCRMSVTLAYTKITPVITRPSSGHNVIISANDHQSECHANTCCLLLSTLLRALTHIVPRTRGRAPGATRGDNGQMVKLKLNREDLLLKLEG